MADLRDRKDEIHRFLAWLTQTLTERPVSSYRVCSADGPDLNTLDTLLFDTYLTARAEGKDEATARQRVLDALAQRKPAGLP
jgi:hypothetical protein